MLSPCPAVLCSFGLAVALTGQKPLVLDPGIHHLGDTTVRSWPGGTPAPEGLELKLGFETKANAAEQVLIIRHYQVDNSWPIRINGKAIGYLRSGNELKDQLYLVPPGALRDGKNELLIRCNRPTDDILVGKVRLIPQTQREYLHLRKLHVKVRDERGKRVPARITVTGRDGREFAPVYYAACSTTAVRPGMVYTANGDATFELPEGAYRIYASHGMEWGIDEKRIVVAGAKERTHTLRIEPEVDTTGYIVSDSHIHTHTFSGHGDSTVEERMVTLAAEGVELPIATDHHHHTDYRPYQEKMKLTKHFTPVVGNEVSAMTGHFNAFPLDPKDKIPAFKTKDWVRVVEGLRGRGAKVVILNHPRWPRIATTSPFGKQHFQLNRISGERKSGPAFTFDAMELVNTTTKMRDPLFVFVDWFALLNHGERIAAVGSSDSHTVGDIVGQGRTYLRSSTDDPARIDIEEACKSYREGLSSVSCGLFTEVLVEEEHAMGATLTLKEAEFRVAFRVACASWVKPDRARLFVNGRLVANRVIRTKENRPFDEWLEFSIPKPKNDAYLVCIATGPGVQGRFWRGAATPQYVLGATNPVFLDVDGDGQYTSPREQALALIEKTKGAENRLVAALRKVDDAVAVQTLGALYDGRFSDAGGARERVAMLRRVASLLDGRSVVAEYAKMLK